MPRQDRYDQHQWEHMNRAETQLKLRKDLLSCVERFLDTTPEDQDYTTRMADIVCMLENYAKGDRQRECDEFAARARRESNPDGVDSRKSMLWRLAISALSDAEAGLKVASDQVRRSMESREAFHAGFPTDSEVRSQIADRDAREEKEWEAAIDAIWEETK